MAPTGLTPLHMVPKSHIAIPDVQAHWFNNLVWQMLAALSRMLSISTRTPPKTIHQMEMTEVSGWLHKEDVFRRLAHVGLLGSVWPAGKVFLGMSVCKWMRSELLSHFHTVVIEVSGRQNIKKHDLARGFRRLCNSNVSIQWRERENPSFERLLEGISLAMYSTASSNNFRVNQTPSVGFGSALTHLDLGWNSLGVGGAYQLYLVLKKCNSLRHLNLRSTQLDNLGTKHIAELLFTCFRLEYLDLGWNAIGDSGGVSLALPLAMGHLRKLSLLDLGGNYLSSLSLGRLAPGVQRCTSLKHLDLSHNSDCGNEGAAQIGAMLAKNKSIETLILGGCRISASGSERLVAGAMTATNLKHLDLSANHLGDDGLKPVAQMLIYSTTLQTLNLRKNKITCNGAKDLADKLNHCPTFTSLDMSVNYLSSTPGEPQQVGTAGAQALGNALRSSSKFKRLSLEACRIMDAGANELAMALAWAPGRRPPQLSPAPNSPPPLLSRPQQVLQQLGFSFAPWQTRPRAALEIMDQRSVMLLQLEHLDLRGNAIGDAGIRPLAEALTLCPNLSILELAGNLIADDGVQHIALNLQWWSKLQRLDVCENQFGNRGAWALAEGIGQCQHLSYLNVGGNFVGARARAILQAKFSGQTFVFV
eukprot:CAMPEP_0181311394 /NCGR_PEP_ID=MMETSP1101-20121128/13110_1 /TAXON_ID=46948 /ORGANISM="Rhodomonas abbreviata, Strain Caron Lab Isolate" /LENGTH=644 /DNA_ID=CAMNT_0023418115 /DNA_START=71 /DNA_END=2005 /DNA_ORIENTATION=-